jgi:hypothetical protein
LGLKFASGCTSQLLYPTSCNLPVSNHNSERRNEARRNKRETIKLKYRGRIIKNNSLNIPEISGVKKGFKKAAINNVNRNGPKMGFLPCNSISTNIQKKLVKNGKNKTSVPFK